MSNELLRVAVGDGKFLIIQDGDGSSYALRYGEAWQAYPKGGSVGNLALSCGHEIDSLRKQLAEIYAALGVHGQNAALAKLRAQAKPPLELV